MMHNKNFKKYYFIDKFEYSNLINKSKNISFIWRNKDKETPINTLIKLRNFCKKNQRNFYISNNLELANKVGANGLYISSNNNDLKFKILRFKKNFKVLGSAHNFKEIQIKKLQNVQEIFISPLFKDKKNKQLDIYKYLNLRNFSLIKDISLGGIDNDNIKKLKMIKPFGFAGISYFQKKRPLKKGAF